MPALAAATLAARGYTSVAGPFASVREAFATAASVITAADSDPQRQPSQQQQQQQPQPQHLPQPPQPRSPQRHQPPPQQQLEIIGDFLIPPTDGSPSRDFQTLHFDFGVPLIPAAKSDVARYTALHVALDSPPSEARTRLVPLDRLLGQRAWPRHDELLRRFAAYGESHGAWPGADGYVEGSLARIVEAAASHAPVLASVKDDPGFLCGNEFATLAAELDFFTAHELPVKEVQIELTLQPGALMIFDNLALAHGRRGVRRPGELHQRVFGYRAASPSCQREIRDRMLAAFGAPYG
jgi:hypothetical protein